MAPLTLPAKFIEDFRWLCELPIFANLLIVLCFVATIVHYQLSCPRSLRHLKRVSPYKTLWSYAIRESVDQRIRRLILPFAEQGESAVAVYMLGRWGVHILDPSIIKQVCSDIHTFPKKNYQEHLHFTFLSGPNVVFSNGEQWKRHSASVKTAFDRNMPVPVFAELAMQVFVHVGTGGVRRWTDLMQRFTLDVVGRAALGHNFDAMSTAHGGPGAEGLSFVDHFNRVMANIATPSRLMFPFLDTIFPRKAVLADVDALNARYDGLLRDKREKPGRDILSYLLEDDRMSDEELRSNLSILFSAGHDTTAGALSSAVYYLATHPAIQADARAEARRALSSHIEPNLADLKSMPLLDAVVREAMRINPPIALLPARVAHTDVVLRSATAPSSCSDADRPDDERKSTVVVPAGIPIVLNVYAVHHTARFFPDPDVFDPSRFLAFAADDAHAVRPGTFLPFGTGPRQCVARQFSLFEQKTLLSLLLVRYAWVLPAGSLHAYALENEFGAFGLSVPHKLDIQFLPVGKAVGEKTEIENEEQ